MLLVVMWLLAATMQPVAAVRPIPFVQLSNGLLLMTRQLSKMPCGGNVPLKMASCGRGEVPGQNLPWVHEVTVEHVPGASFAAMAPGGRMLVMFSEYCPASYAPAGSSVVRGKLRYGPKAKPGRSKRTGVCNLLHHDLPSGQRHVVAGGFRPQPRTMHEPAWLPFSWYSPPPPPPPPSPTHIASSTPPYMRLNL